MDAPGTLLWRTRILRPHHPFPKCPSIQQIYAKFCYCSFMGVRTLYRRHPYRLNLVLFGLGDSQTGLTFRPSRSMVQSSGALLQASPEEQYPKP